MTGRILICMGTSGLAAGAEEVAAAFARELKRNGLCHAFRVVRVGDRGLFRDVLVDIETEAGRTVYEFVRPDDVPAMVEQHLVSGKPYGKRLAGKDYEAFFTGQQRVVLSRCGETDPESIEAYIEHDGYRGLRAALALTPGSIIDLVERSGLRGRGGAGFLTGRKWAFCRQAPGTKKYVVCNADEGDPGAFMDRSLLEGDPHTVIEGMLIAARAVGADEGVMYCRAEYPLAVKRIRVAIEQARRSGCLGKNVQGSDFSCDLWVMQGAGAFVCGEETALLASIEGRRGTPRSKPPFPAQRGLHGCPTLINNVETLAAVPAILARGPEWFSGIGTPGSKGTKVFSLAGKVRRTGLAEVPMGTTIRELVFGPGGGMARRRVPFKGVQLGGPSGGCLPETMLDTPIDYESIHATGAIMGSGGVIVMDAKTCMVDVARYFVAFTVAESCGQCVPCRVGLQRLLEVLDRITEGKGREEDLAFLEDMGRTIQRTSLCGLGQTAPNPVLTTLRYFRKEFETHVRDKTCPAGVCKALLRFEVDQQRCTACGVCARACPADAILWSKGRKARIDPDRCTRCRACIQACEFMAIQ